jgi:cytochrome P450
MGELRDRDWFSDASLVEDPFPYYEAVRAEGPVFHEPNHGMFVFTGYDEILEVYRDVEGFSSCNVFSGPFYELPGAPYGDDVTDLIEQYRSQMSGSDDMLTQDPPVHTDQRGLMMRLMTPRRIEETAESIWQMADDRIDSFIGDGKCDFMADYARPLSMLFIAELLGVPEEDRPALKALFARMGAPGKVGTKMPDKPLWFLDDFFRAYIEDRRCNPRDDVLTKLATNTHRDGTLPEVMEAVRVATVLFAGGQGTSARFLGNALQFLGEHADIQQQLRRDPALVPPFVEEMLRFNSPVKKNSRMARKKTSIGGAEIPAGSTVFLLLPAAARDPRHFECPAEFHLDRTNARDHIAFGRGPHTCPGAPLVRTSARITIQRMLERFGEIRISEKEHGPPDARRYDYTDSIILRGLNALDLEFTPT